MGRPKPWKNRQKGVFLQHGKETVLDSKACTPKGEDAAGGVGAVGLAVAPHSVHAGEGALLGGFHQQRVPGQGQQHRPDGLFEHEELLLVADHADVILHLPCTPLPPCSCIIILTILIVKGTLSGIDPCSCTLDKHKKRAMCSCSFFTGAAAVEAFLSRNWS